MLWASDLNLPSPELKVQVTEEVCATHQTAVTQRLVLKGEQ